MLVLDSTNVEWWSYVYEVPDAIQRLIMRFLTHNPMFLMSEDGLKLYGAWLGWS